MEKTTFANCAIAHDLNNIIAIIFGNAELTLDIISSENPVRHNIEEVFAASNRAKDLIRNAIQALNRNGEVKVS